MRRVAAAGFTLAEMLVALFITGMISAAGAALLISAAQSGKRLSDFSDNLQKVEVAQALIRNDLFSMLPLTFDPEDRFGVSSGLAWRPVRQDGSLMQFYRNGWLHPQKEPVRSDIQAVEYAVEDGALVRIAHLPALKREAFPRREIFSDVERAEMRVFEGGRWMDAPEYSSENEVTWPELIELSVFFKDERSFRIVALSGTRR